MQKADQRNVLIYFHNHRISKLWLWYWLRSRNRIITCARTSGAETLADYGSTTPPMSVVSRPFLLRRFFFGKCKWVISNDTHGGTRGLTTKIGRECARKIGDVCQWVAGWEERTWSIGQPVKGYIARHHYIYVWNLEAYDMRIGVYYGAEWVICYQIFIVYQHWSGSLTELKLPLSSRTDFMFERAGRMKSNRSLAWVFIGILASTHSEVLG